MEHHGHTSLNRTAFAATWHCLTGCAIGEVLGLAIATALDWGNVASIALAVVLAFFFGYLLTLRPLVTGGVPFRNAARSEEHTSELQSHSDLVCRLLLEKKKK